MMGVFDFFNSSKLSSAVNTFSFWQRIKTTIFNQNQLDQKILDKLEENFIQADLGVEESRLLLNHLQHCFAHRKLATSDFKKEIKHHLINRLEYIQLKKKAISCDKENTEIILVVGINGVGKTTSIGKLALHWSKQGYEVLLGAADTFRAAAFQQLKEWVDRLPSNVQIHGSDHHKEPAAVAYQTISKAIEKKIDKVIIDTAGRLHTKQHLMQELAKIKRVITKLLPQAPHHIWLVVDGTMGQNAFAQATLFKEVLPLTGLIVTKLDGVAKGGVLVRICAQLQLPIYYVGSGELENDLVAFSSEEYVKNLLTASPTDSLSF